VQGEGQIGFGWVTPSGAPTTLPDLVADPVVGADEPDRLIATHLAALDDALMIAAGRFGELLGGGRRPSGPDRDDLLELHRAVDRLCQEYARAAAALGIAPDVRAGQIIGTAALFSVRARLPLGLLGPAPFDGELDDPGLGVLGGFGEFHELDPAAPWRGGRWVLRTEDGRRFPLTLSMLLHDSSGVRKDATLVEHRAAVRTVVSALDLPGADPAAAACALDWLLYDWLMAHRDGPDSAAIEIPPGREADAAMVVDAAAASVRARATLDPGLAGPLAPRR
jgi:hypothetical protein